MPEIDITGFGLFATRIDDVLTKFWLLRSEFDSSGPHAFELHYGLAKLCTFGITFPLFGLSRPALFAFVSEFAHSDSVSFLRSLARLGFTPPVFISFISRLF